MSVTTAFRIDAFRRLCEARGAPVYVARRGDPQAGAIIVKLSRLDGAAEIYARRYDLDGGAVWALATGDAPVAEAEADAYIARRAATDPDLWAIEVELRSGLPPFDALSA